MVFLVSKTTTTSNSSTGSYPNTFVRYMQTNVVGARIDVDDDSTASSSLTTCFINENLCSATAAGVIVSSSASSLPIHDKTDLQITTPKQSTVTERGEQRVVTKSEECVVKVDTAFEAKPHKSGIDAEQSERENLTYETRSLVHLDNRATLNGNTLLVEAATCSGSSFVASSSSFSQCYCRSRCVSLCKCKLCSSPHKESCCNHNIRGVTKGITAVSSLLGSTLRNFLSRKFCVSAVSRDDDNEHVVKSPSLSEAKLHRISSTSIITIISNTCREGKDSQQQSSTPSSLLSAAVTPVPEIPGSEDAPSPDSLIMKEEKQLEFILKSLVAGGVAGMCAKSAVAPLDRMKILLQAHSKHYSHLGVFSGLRGIVEKERFIALYKGNGAQMVRIFPYAATQFTSFELYRKLFGEESHIGRFAAGSAAGVTAVALTYPLDTIRARLAFQVTGEHMYSGIYSCATHIFREEGGIRALYRGFIPTVCGMIPYAGLSFYCFESFKYICMKYFPTYTCKSHSTNTGGLVLLLYAKLLCGGVAGAAAQTVAYPLDVTRRRMQLAMMDEKTKKFGLGMVSTIKLIYQENGIMRGLYRGMSINYLRAIPMVAVSFSTYELVKQMLRLDTGLPIKTG